MCRCMREKEMHLIQIASVCIDADSHASMPSIQKCHVYRYMRWMRRCQVFTIALCIDTCDGCIDTSWSSFWKNWIFEYMDRCRLRLCRCILMLNQFLMNFNAVWICIMHCHDDYAQQRFRSQILVCTQYGQEYMWSNFVSTRVRTFDVTYTIT